MQRTYLAIDLKSYYASAECAARHLDPLTTNLVVADSSRTEKTICLAVSPSLKTYGIPGRARLFEVVQKVKEVNANRLREAVRLRKADPSKVSMAKYSMLHARNRHIIIPGCRCPIVLKSSLRLPPYEAMRMRLLLKAEITLKEIESSCLKKARKF